MKRYYRVPCLSINLVAFNEQLICRISKLNLCSHINKQQHRLARTAYIDTSRNTMWQRKADHSARCTNETQQDIQKT